MSLAIQAVFQMNRAQVGDLTVFGDANTETNHLTNNVHQLWAYRNWSRNVRAKNMPRPDGKEAMKKPLTKGAQRARCQKLPAHTYERMLPALRLASLFLHKSLPWLWNLRYAPYKRLRRKGQTVLQLDDGDWTKEKRDQIRQDLDTIAQRYFLLHGLHGHELSATAVSTASYLNMDADEPEDPEEDWRTVYREKRGQPLTIVAKEAIDFVGSQDWVLLPLAMQHRCLFQLASLLMHELAHIVIFHRADDVLINNEPYFRETEAAREAGFSWEYYMFGGIVTVVDGEFTGNKPGTEIEGVSINLQWPHSFQSHVQMFEEWKHPKFCMDDLKHPPGRWLVATESIGQFFDIRRWKRWLAVPVKHGPMANGPFALHLSSSLFMSLLQEKSMSFDVWYLRRLHHAAGLAWQDVTNYDSHYSSDDQTSSPLLTEDPDYNPSGDEMDID